MSNALMPAFVELYDNRVPVYYAGGANINKFRKLTTKILGPEDWVGSTCCLPAAILPTSYPLDTGVSRTKYGLLTELIAFNPEWWLGLPIAEKFAGDFPLLVKLLDAGERLPVHAHPSREFANINLKSKYGKTEAWIILAAESDSKVWLGLKNSLPTSEFLHLIQAQDVDAMLANMNEYSVKSGDIIYVPAGTLHSIGTGVFLIELQEPTSFSILCEYAKFCVNESAATLGLGWESALRAIDFAQIPDPINHYFVQETVTLNDPDFELTSLFPKEADVFFRASRLRASDSGSINIDSMVVVVVESGSGSFTYEDEVFTFEAGMTFAVAAGVSELRFTGKFELILCQTPIFE